jgi:hypothetical protein
MVAARSSSGDDVSCTQHDSFCVDWFRLSGTKLVPVVVEGRVYVYTADWWVAPDIRSRNRAALHRHATGYRGTRHTAKFKPRILLQQGWGDGVLVVGLEELLKDKAAALPVSVPGVQPNMLLWLPTAWRQWFTRHSGAMSPPSQKTLRLHWLLFGTRRSHCDRSFFGSVLCGKHIISST